MLSPETQTKLNELRLRIANGDMPSIEEQREAILLLRSDRRLAVESGKSKPRSKISTKSGEDLLAELDGL